METAAGRVAVISGDLGLSDTLGGWKARWGIGRMSYIVPPGLYAIGSPDQDAPVLVTANYKMSYDLVRSTIKGHSVWLLVLETYGINVWCAAGKGTFGTGELVKRIGLSGLEKVVNHRTLLLPIMGAAGVKAVEVKKRTGFDVRFATLRIQDLPEYLENGMQATPAMRELTFSLRERLVLVPMELVIGVKSVLFVGAPLAAAYGAAGGDFSLIRFWEALVLYLVAVVCGSVLTPLLLPFLPGRMFSIKGAVAGVAVSAGIFVSRAGALTWREICALGCVTASVSAFYAMNFTGSTPYTSPSGVRREMGRSLPVMAGALGLAVVILLAGIFSA